jgi:hypothetical protein
LGGHRLFVLSSFHTGRVILSQGIDKSEKLA